MNELFASILGEGNVIPHTVADNSHFQQGNKVLKQYFMDSTNKISPQVIDDVEIIIYDKK